MNLRTKLALALAGLAAFATVALGLSSYSATRTRLEAEIDGSLDHGAQEMAVRVGRDGSRPRPGASTIQPRPLDDGDVSVTGQNLEQVVVQILAADGSVRTANVDGISLPITEVDRAIAASQVPVASPHHDITVDGQHYRIMTVSFGSGGGAVQVARSLDETDRVLDSLAGRTIVAVIVVVIGGAIIGALIARQITRRLVRLTSAAEHVAQTGELDVAAPVSGNDEAGRLGAAFNEMLAALARSKSDQQRLVQDAGHELRTPLTSLRTNISVLRRHHDLKPETLAKVLDDLDGETRELTSLVNELVQLATEQRDDEPVTEVRLDALAHSVADRAQRRTARPIVVEADPTVLIARRAALERALGNLVENALKFDSSDQPIVISVKGGRVEVRDHGPGIAPEDLPHLFDRFYRSISSRSKPGSGLGLSIVADVVTGHGGSTFAANRPEGGACIGFDLPLTPA